MRRAVLLVMLAFAGRELARCQPPPLEELKKQALELVEGRRALTQQMVDAIFSFAELGFQEVETSAYVIGILEKNGFQVTRGVAGMPTAFVATWGSGKPVIGFMADIDGLPETSQKPGVAYQAPLIENGPGHGEGHNSHQAVNVTAAVVVKQLMEKYKLPGTLRVYPGVAEELLASRTYMVLAGLFRDVDAMLSCHISSDFGTGYGPVGSGLVSTQYTFHGRSAHAAGAPWAGRSALDAVELMDVAWNFRREHLRPEHRSHYVIVNGGDQPNVVPPVATVWYFFREWDYERIRELHEIGTRIANAAALMTDTTMTERVLAATWPGHFNKPLAEALHANIKRVGMPEWSEADEKLARAAQAELKAKPQGMSKEIRELRRGLLEPAHGGAAVSGQHPGHDRSPLVERHCHGHAHRAPRLDRRRQGPGADSLGSTPQSRAAGRGPPVLRRADQGHPVEVADPGRHAAAPRAEPRENGALPGAAPEAALRSGEVQELPGAVGHRVPDGAVMEVRSCQAR
jgi:aminobenzoyl-glutamate utilization protein B